MTDLEKQISEVANAVEHTIQLRLTDAVMTKNKNKKEKACGRLRHSLQQVAEDIDHVWKESTKIQDEGKLASKESLVQDSSSEKHTLNVENNMVGRDDQRKRLLVELTQYGGSSSELKVIPIVGMGGIGLLSLVRSRKGDSFYMKGEAELADMLRKSLKGKRYLIVLDDMWKSEACDDLRLCFPSENKGSRILLTTRDSEVACYASTENPSLYMGFMDPDESWNLFKSTVFENEALPSGFETIGRQIVDKCQGLPLTIVVVAGILSKSERTMEVWENVAKDVKSFVKNDPDELCLHVLGLSYNHLTSDLKACLLYFGIFPKDSEILVKRLVRLWITEGFLKLEKDLEPEAEKCLQDLVDRFLVLVSRKDLAETKIKRCKVHDLIYELCLRELAQSQNVFVMNDIVYDNKPNHVHPKCCYLSSHTIQPSKRWEDDVIDRVSYRALLNPGHHNLKRGKTDDDDKNLLKQTRSIFSSFSHLSTFTLESKLIRFNFLRILDLSHVSLKNFPPQILSLIWLRYLVLRGSLIMPPEICRLWNLQTFIVDSSSTIFPEQIWELMQLRHLKVFSFYLPNPPSVTVDEEEMYLVFSNIQTISGLSPSSCTKEVISGIRNVKKLIIYGNIDDYESSKESRLLEILVHLHQLETLSLCVVSSHYSTVTIPNAKAFPPMLKKLKLNGTGLMWEDLNIIGEMLTLEVLKLMLSACHSEEWQPAEGGFTRLKLLLIEGNHLKY
ncbi:putative late blight resistance protein -like r1b-14 [Nicotiana attenuata]|uniref:Late blight resistance protein -like r1b-14 n=1 Tax=Nicotiana attenuata TaxID=49451 RepID=A0A1J6IRU8_NICAT|nr:putative late blight resistance protein -like r1b-14 [Nicotiana attenuata]